jgi:SNF2 family DNA or RNA helicase
LALRTYADLHDYQQTAITRLYEHREQIAVLPMGAGKTVIGMTAALEAYDEGVIDAAIILAPKRVAAEEWAKQWTEWEHLKRFGALLRMVVGSPAKRLKALNDPNGVFYVVGIDNTAWLVEQMEQWDTDDPRFDLLMIDELSRYKGPTGKRSREMTLIADRFQNRWGLTGTPRPSSEEQLWMPIRIIGREAQIWPEPFDEWRMRYFMPDDIFTQFRWSIREEWKDKIWSDAAKISFTVPESELPPRPLLEPIIHWVDLPTRARDRYREMLRHLVTEVDGDIVAAMNRAVASGKLDQIAQGFIYDDGETLARLHNEKLKALQDIVLAADGDQILLTYHFREDLMILREAFPGLPNIGSDTSGAIVSGLIEAWNSREIDMLAVHPASAGHGLNLQKSGARQIVHYCPTWSSELYAQVNARLARQGNTSSVVYNHLILARGTTDELKLARLTENERDERAFIEYLEKAR